MTRIKIPQAFENMEEATIGKWLKSEGDAIENGDALCELITEKTTFDLPVEHLPAAGILKKLIAAEKSIVPVGSVIAIAGDASEELLEDILADVARENAALLEKRQATENTPVASVPVSIAPREVAAPPTAGTRVRATPAARRVAKERGLSIEDIAAALPAKVLTEEDVLQFGASS